jgi:hypothetical protein
MPDYSREVYELYLPFSSLSRQGWYVAEDEDSALLEAAEMSRI